MPFASGNVNDNMRTDYKIAFYGFGSFPVVYRHLVELARSEQVPVSWCTILSQPNYPNTVPAAEVAARLYDATQGAAHAFWPDSISLLAPGALDWSRLLSARHLTDAYLLALAVEHRARLVTLDESVPIAAVKGAKDKHLVVVA